MNERLVGFANVHPYDENAERRLRHAIEHLGFHGLKLHPRLQHFDLDDSRVVSLVRAAGDLGVPALVDAFPDGDWLMMGFEPRLFGRLAQSCPETSIIFGHFGGHHCIDLMMMAKRLDNMYFDFSFSLLYYYSRSVVENLLYSCKSMKCRRIFYGSDYPAKDFSDSLRESRRLFEAGGFSDSEIDDLFFNNVAAFLQWRGA